MPKKKPAELEPLMAEIEARERRRVEAIAEKKTERATRQAVLDANSERTKFMKRFSWKGIFPPPFTAITSLDWANHLAASWRHNILYVAQRLGVRVVLPTPHDSWEEGHLCLLRCFSPNNQGHLALVQSTGSAPQSLVERVSEFRQYALGMVDFGVAPVCLTLVFACMNKASVQAFGPLLCGNSTWQSDPLGDSYTKPYCPEIVLAEDGVVELRFRRTDEPVEKETPITSLLWLPV